MVRQYYRVSAHLRQFYAQLTGQWAKVIASGVVAVAILSNCATEQQGASRTRVRMQVPPGVAKVVVIGSAAEVDHALPDPALPDRAIPERVIHDELGRSRRPTSILLKPDRDAATTTWIDPSPLSELSVAEGTALATPRLENTRRVVLLRHTPRAVAGMLELCARPNQPALEVLAERSLLDELLVDRAVAAALGSDALSFRAIEPQTRIDLGDGLALTLLRIGDDLACRIDGPKRRILYAPRISDPSAPGWEQALAQSDFRLLDARLDPRATVSLSATRRVPAVPAAAHRIRGFPAVANSVRFIALDERYGIDGERFIDDFRARGFEIVYEGDEYWL